VVEPATWVVIGTLIIAAGIGVAKRRRRRGKK